MPHTDTRDKSEEEKRRRQDIEHRLLIIYIMIVFIIIMTLIGLSIYFLTQGVQRPDVIIWVEPKIPTFFIPIQT